FIEETAKTIDELNREKEEHSEIIQQINQDKCDLEKQIDDARFEQRERENQLARKYETLLKLMESSNEKIRESGLGEESTIQPDDIPHARIPNERIRSLQACYSDVCIEQSLLSDLRNHLANCQKTEEDLENERKSHAEELRQINQDINQLEDILKTLRSERETKRARLTKRMDELRVAMNQANESMR
ncbi:hypothetical protein TELCIR_12906, partial [Teladorsagia circumcincta]